MKVLMPFTQKIQAVVDVGSHAIRAALFDVRNGEPLILDKKVIQLPARPDPERTASSLRDLIYRMVGGGGRTPSKIVVGLGPEMGRELLAIWTARPPEKAARVDRETAREYFENLAEQYKNTGEAFVAYPAEVFINSYPVSLDGGVVAGRLKELQFRVLLLSIPARAGSILADAKRGLGGVTVDFIPLAASYRESFVELLGAETAFLIDIGGENTSLTLIKDGRVEGFASFSLGGRHFVRGLGRTASVPFREAEDMARHEAEGGIMGVRGEKGTTTEGETWKKEFLESLDTFYTIGPLPKDIFLFGGGANMPEVTQYLAKGDWMDKYSYVRSPNVRVARAESFFGGSTLGGAIAGPDNVGLASLILYSMHHKSLL